MYSSGFSLHFSGRGGLSSPTSCPPLWGRASLFSSFTNLASLKMSSLSENLSVNFLLLGFSFSSIPVGTAPPSPGPDPGVAVPLTCCVVLSGVGTPLRNFVMEGWSSFLSEVYFFWRFALLIILGGKSSSFLTFFGPKLGLFFLGSLLSKSVFQARIS